MTAGLYDRGVLVPLRTPGVTWPELTTNSGGENFLPLGGNL